MVIVFGIPEYHIGKIFAATYYCTSKSHIDAYHLCRFTKISQHRCSAIGNVIIYILPLIDFLGT